MFGPVPPRTSDARGLLVEFYANGSEQLHQLRDRGYVHLKGAVPQEDVARLVAGFDETLATNGYSGRFANPSTIKTPDALPDHFWGLDPVILPFCDAAMEARCLVRDALAHEAGVESNTLLASFDAVMASWPGYGTQPPFNPNEKRLPVKTKPDGKPAGPGHIDQRATNTATADSHQCFLALTPAKVHDMSTVLLVPRGSWTLQGMMDACREKFPKAFDPSLKNGGDDGMFFSADAQEWLVQKGIARAIKPDMAPGDVLVWSSAVPHCGGAAKPPAGTTRHPRLGIVVGFCPASLVPKEAKEKRRKLVGSRRATGQQVHRPNPHMSVPPSLRGKRVNDWPVPYRKIHEFREGVAEGSRAQLFQETLDESEEQRAKKRRVRSLLG